MDFIAQQMSLIIEPCTIISDDQPDGFSNESSFAFFTSLCCSATACVTICPVVFQTLLLTFPHIHRRKLFDNFQLILITLIVSSIVNQVTSAFVTRPLAMFLDVRFLSMLGIQLIGFGLCLFLSFIYGVVYASARSVNRAST
jgi:hypothetical protein